MFTRASDALSFIRGGEAYVTATSRTTNNHYTYKVVREKDGKMWWVYYMTAPDAYTYMATITATGEVRLTQKSKLVEESPPFIAFKWIYGNLERGVIPPNLELRHDGRCCVCGKQLTNPISIDIGMGPDCRKRICTF